MLVGLPESVGKWWDCMGCWLPLLVINIPNGKFEVMLLPMVVLSSNRVQDGPYNFTIEGGMLRGVSSGSFP